MSAADAAAPAACREAARALAACVEAHSPCARAGGGILACLARGEPETEAACGPLRGAYTHCRRSGLDMRTRIRGRRELDTGHADGAAPGEG